MKYEKRSFNIRDRKKTAIIAGVVILSIVVTSVFFGYRMIYQGWSLPVQESSELVLFVVEEDDTIDTVADRLEKDNLIRKASVFKDQAKSLSFTTVLAGEFAIDRSWTLQEIVETLSDEENILAGHLNIMFPPGYWAKDFAHKLANLTYLDEEEILSKWTDKSFVQSLQQDYPFLTDEIFQEGSKNYLEGYLYPETYNFLTTTTVEEATRIILNQTQVIYDKYKSEFEKSEYTIHQIFTLASIVNFEAATLEDMKLVAQVFYNRLAIDMLMQSSVTVCYALYDFEQWIDCESNTDIDSPYNTYLHKGLPIGPVMNPVENALIAVFNPTPTDALYFVADVETGVLYFAKTYEEHLENVEKHVDIYR